mmetsp:Transcript_55219/g.165430  ORF Transcript_55219/g.165430 Transcript_55219/m.165430 type:complete len:262 (-) Transcript_55219:215-1000(-)
MVQSLSFASYEAIRRTLDDDDGRDDRSGRRDLRGRSEEDHLRNVGLSAFASGSIVSVVTGPLVGLKVRQQLTGKSLREALREASSRGGGGPHRGGGLPLRGLYAGYPAHFLCESVGRAVFFVCYEDIKARMIRSRRIPFAVAAPANADDDADDDVIDDVSCSIPERMIAATIAGVISCASVLPFDAVRTRALRNARMTSASSSSSSTSVAAAMELWRSGGPRAFARGFALAAARGGPVSAVAMPVYDAALDHFRGCGGGRY